MEIRRYIKDVSKYLKCSKASRRKCLRSLSKAINALQDKGAVTYELCVKEYGPPEKVAEEYLSQLTKKELQRFKKKHAVLIAVVVCILIAFLIAIYMDMSSERPGVIKDTGQFEETSELI